MVSFKNGEPVDGSASTTAAKDIFANADNSLCPNDCFRPAGLVFDQNGRLFVSSDASGEIYMITKSSTAASGKMGSSTNTGSGGRTLVAEASALQLPFVALLLLLLAF